MKYSGKISKYTDHCKFRSWENPKGHALCFRLLVPLLLKSTESSKSPCRPMNYTFYVMSNTETYERDGSMDTRKGKRKILRFADKAELSSSSCIFLSLTMSSQIKALENYAMVGYWHSDGGGWGSACSGHMEITEASGALWEEKTQFIIRSVLTVTRHV